MPLQTQKVGPHEREPSFALAPYHEGEVAKVIWSATASLGGQMDLRKLDRSRVLPTINVNWRISSFRVLLLSYKDRLYSILLIAIEPLSLLLQVFLEYLLMVVVQKQMILRKIKGFAKALIATADTRCLKIKGKVSFNISSEASYIYILSGQKFIMPKLKNTSETFWVIFKQCAIEAPP